MKREFNVVIERDSDGFYVASVPELRGCHTQARSLDKLLNRIKEAIRGNIPSLIAFLILLASSFSALAGGSVGYEERAIPLLRTQPDLLRFVQQSLDVAPVGWGVRLGRDFGDRVGERIPPFHFEARPKGHKGPYTLVLTINDPKTGLSPGDATSTIVTIEIHQLIAK